MDFNELKSSATFPINNHALSKDREMPKHSDLVEYKEAVAGHAGTLCDADGELFIKPCTETEVNFYESARALHPDFAEWMPTCFGTLALTENMTDEMIHDAIPAIIENADIPTHLKEEIQSHLHHDERKRAASVPQPIKRVPTDLHEAAAAGVEWIPSKGRKITTNRAVVLQNASFGFKRPNIMDAKLGIRLWADDAPLEKRERFDKIAQETTHQRFGFRVAGMRVYKGSRNTSELDEENYRIYDKDWGRLAVTDGNVVESLRKFIFNEAAGIDEDMGKVVSGAFATDLKRVQEVLEADESRMYSSSLLFVFEGDGEALRSAIDESIGSAQRSTAAKGVATELCGTLRLDSGIDMGDDGEIIPQGHTASLYDEDDDDDESADAESDELSSHRRIYSLQLIDFAHAKWTPGLGPDQNVLVGVRSLAKLFEQMSE